MKKLIPILLVAACGVLTSTSPPGLMSSEAATACVDPATYGATIDGPDARDAVQEAVVVAIASRRPVCLPCGGLLNVERRTTGTDKHRTIRIHSDLTLTGCGIGNSGLRMSGSGVVPGGFAPGDWWLLDVQGGALRISNMTLDGAARTDTGEQTHLLHVSGPSKGTTVVDVEVRLPKLVQPAGAVSCIPSETDPDYNTRQCHYAPSGTALCKTLGPGARCAPNPGPGATWQVHGWYNAGDCIRLLGGAPPDYVDSTTISRVMAPECDRSTIGVQRGVQNLWIDHLSTKTVGDQAIEFEPSNNGQIRWVTIRDSSIHTGRGHGIAVTLWGNDLPATDILMERVDLDGLISMHKVEDVTIRDVTIRVDGRDNEAPIAIAKAGRNVRLIDVVVERGTAAAPPPTAGPLVALNPHAGTWPSTTKIVRGRYTQWGDGTIISAGPVDGLLVDGADLECNATGAGAYSAITLSREGTTATLSPIKVTNVTVSGGCKYGVQVGAGASTVVVTDSIMNVTSTGAGVRFVGVPTVKPVVSGNVITSPSGPPPAPAVHPVTQPYTGANTP